MNEPTHLDLFSGIGGFALAAQWAGFRTVAFCEIEPYCQAILKARFGAVMADTAGRGRNKKQPKTRRGESDTARSNPDLHSDIRTLDGRRYTGADLLTGGFPCQPFSVAGKRAGAADNRFLWPEMLRVVSEARPAWIVGENVAGIINMELDRCLSDLEGIGYAVWPLVIPACAVDARHRRDRVWIVAHAGSGGWQSGSTGWRGKVSPGSCDEFSESSQNADAVANTDDSSRLEQSQRRICDEWRRVSNASNGRSPNGTIWLHESDVGRVAHGVSKRVDRLKGLGNAIVPQVAFQILKTIRELIT